jgi:hypothetical protein
MDDDDQASSQHRFCGGVWAEDSLDGLGDEDRRAHHSACLEGPTEQARSGTGHGPVEE